MLGGALTYTGSSQGAVALGNYVIAPGGLTSTNYAITYANGNLSITTPGSVTPALSASDPASSIVAGFGLLGNTVFSGGRFYPLSTSLVACREVGDGAILCSGEVRFAGQSNIFSGTRRDATSRLDSVEPKEAACRQTGAGQILCSIQTAAR